MGTSFLIDFENCGYRGGKRADGEAPIFSRIFFCASPRRGAQTQLSHSLNPTSPSLPFPPVYCKFGINTEPNLLHIFSSRSVQRLPGIMTLSQHKSFMTGTLREYKIKIVSMTLFTTPNSVTISDRRCSEILSSYLLCRLEPPPPPPSLPFPPPSLPAAHFLAAVAVGSPFSSVLKAIV